MYISKKIIAIIILCFAITTSLSIIGFWPQQTEKEEMAQSALAIHAISGESENWVLSDSFFYLRENQMLSLRLGELQYIGDERVESVLYKIFVIDSASEHVIFESETEIREGEKNICLGGEDAIMHGSTPHFILNEVRIEIVFDYLVCVNDNKIQRVERMNAYGIREFIPPLNSTSIL